MNPRKITVVDSKTQKKVIIESGAETLQELKADLANAGIDYEGKTFMEGLSHTELKVDSAILPHDIERNGVVTNDLVFMLTTPEKKIKSGADLSRGECYDKVKSLGLGEEVKCTFGKNFTQVSTADLNAFLANYGAKPAKKETKSEAKPTQQKSAPAKTTTTSGDKVETAKGLINDMLKIGAITKANAENLIGVLDGKAPKAIDTDYSDAEIREMFEGML